MSENLGHDDCEVCEEAKQQHGPKGVNEILSRIREVLFERVRLHGNLDELPIDVCTERMEALTILSARLDELCWVLGVPEDQLRISIKEE